MTVRLLIFCLLISVSPAFSQKQGQDLIDSLVSRIPKTVDDTLKARHYNRIAQEYFFTDTDKALQYSKLGLAHANRMHWNKGIGAFSAAIARAYGDKGNYDSCLLYNQRALAIQQKESDGRNIASTLNNMGVAEQNLNFNFPKAIEYYLKAMTEAEKLGDNYMIAVGYDNISQVYFGQKNFSKALSYAFKGLNIRKKQANTDRSNATREVANSYSSIASIYTEMKQTEKAKSYYKQAIAMHGQVGNKEGLAKAYTNLSSLSADFKNKIEYGRIAETLWNEFNPADGVTNLGNLGNTYLNLFRNDSLGKSPYPKAYLIAKAEHYLNKAIAISKEVDDIDNQFYFTGVLAELQALKGDYKNAYLNFRKYQSVQDSLFSQESKNKIAEMTGEREIAVRDKQLEINKLEFETQKNQRIALIAGVALLAVIGGLLFWQSRTRKRTNVQLLHLNNELDEANQVKARFFAIISHDLRSPVANLVNFLNLQKEAPGLMTAQTVEAHQKRIGDSAETLLETMESMLLWSKSQMQQFKPQARPVQVSGVFEYIQKFFAGTTGVTFTFENPLKLTVVTDEDYLKTIMQNLTSNAVKALKTTPDAYIRWEAKMENDQIILGITDNGPGASSEQLDALYTDQASIGIKTGLGLHLIRDLAKAISCKISVASDVGSGTVFRLTFAE
ncbi:tetratricopeptide repeat-containing sensor histidine kinase [Dyadobacter arcticus]|uniref:histidine kinase n=1 Tax=Dyadobacter arcticus TaxID=1078754 RepID=A0ABX0UQP5_9BACT|nr:tetratricopeptide repeat-containing sensor histidine kinase [Dyadobacter arcticus]NIJ53900.1 signal transduction histidine kinase [Dyadobacter arcticus]